MIKGIDLNQRIEFISEKDKTEPKTIFVFRPLSTIEIIKFTSDNKGAVNFSGEKVFELLNSMIVEVKNGSSGDVPAVLNTLPPSVLTELIQEAGRINQLSEQDAKN